MRSIIRHTFAPPWRTAFCVHCAFGLLAVADIVLGMTADTRLRYDAGHVSGLLWWVSGTLQFAVRASPRWLRLYSGGFVLMTALMALAAFDGIARAIVVGVVAVTPGERYDLSGDWQLEVTSPGVMGFRRDYHLVHPVGGLFERRVSDSLRALQGSAGDSVSIDLLHPGRRHRIVVWEGGSVAAVDSVSLDGLGGG